MREKNAEQKDPPEQPQTSDEAGPVFDPNEPPAPIDEATFRAKLGEIIFKALAARRRRN
jgi:hypothetical protein